MDIRLVTSVFLAVTWGGGRGSEAHPHPAHDSPPSVTFSRWPGPAELNGACALSPLLTDRGGSPAGDSQARLFQKKPQGFPGVAFASAEPHLSRVCVCVCVS